VAARAADRAANLLVPLIDAAPGTLVKLHGTAAIPGTMAFTDLELISPLGAPDTEHLARLADGRTVVFYGYAGADADLSDLVDEVLARARSVVWFEPYAAAHSDIARAFRHRDRIEFVPSLAPGQTADVPATVAGFLELAVVAGAQIPADLIDQLRINEPLPLPPTLRLAEPSGISQARLVERFGGPASHDRALRVARRADLRARRWRTAPGHARWLVTRSLYRGGLAADAVRALAKRRELLAHLRPRRLRDYVITRQLALLLQASDPPALGEFAQWATSVRATPEGRPYPNDLYYRAQARRYELQPELARADANAAVEGLASVPLRDPERLAGALLESGFAAIYQGRFDDALARAFDLRYRRGRYAIARWRGWGAWLEAIARCYLHDPDAAAEPLAEAEARFAADDRRGPLRDVQSAQLLALRVRRALGRPSDRDDEQLLDAAETDDPRGRYRDDRDLILADLDIAAGTNATAARRLSRVAADPSCPVADRLARLGLAELDRLAGRHADAAHAFAELAADAAARGATWLQSQALVGLGLCDRQPSPAAIANVQSSLAQAGGPPDPHAIAFGEPRVLWLLTV
jgi:hypothetical protein